MTYKIQCTFEGEKGSSILYRPLTIKPENDDSNKEQIELALNRIQKVFSLNDDRLLLVVASMIIEERIDDLLRVFLKKPKELDERDLTFSQRIGLLKSLRLVPSYITNNADLLRLSRNRFAHDIDLDSVDNLPDKILGKLKPYLTENNVSKEHLETRDNRDLFVDITFIAVMGCLVFRGTVHSLSELMNDDTKLEALLT